MPQPLDNPTDTYFATLPTDKIGNELQDKIEKFMKSIDETGRWVLWNRLYKQYYMGHYFKGEIRRMGPNGALRKMSVNHFKNILQYMQVLTTTQRPAFEPRAVNSDYKTYSQVILAKQLLDYYMATHKVEDKITTMLEYATLFGEGWMQIDWDTSQGDVVGKGDEGKNIKNGDLRFMIFSPLDVIRDTTKQNITDHEWFITRRWISKWELAAKYPDWEEDIRKFKFSFYGIGISDRNVYDPNATYSGITGDDVQLYTFIHKRTAAVPTGRQIEFLDNKIVMFDGPLPYIDFPLIPIVPENQVGYPYGYSLSYDMLPIQIAIDSLYSTVITNQLTFGVQNIISPKGTGVTAADLSEGLNLIEYNASAGKPEPLRLLSTPPEIFKFIEELIQQLETISGVNSVARGNPEASLKSGSALALVHSTALQFNRGLQRAYISAVERIGSLIINILKEYAKIPRVAAITGVSNKAYLKQFTSDDLKDIDRVIVDIGNPLTRTVAGKVNVADTLLERGMIKTPEEYMQLLNTGTLAPIMDGKTGEMMLIKSENEKLSNGEQIQAIIVEDHLLHIIEHKPVLSSPEAKDQPELVQAALNHIQQHVEFLRTGDKDLLMLLGQQPIGMQGAPGPLPPGMQPPPQKGSGDPPPPGQNGDEPNIVAQMPNMPTAPGQQQPYNPSSGM